ncbi:unnamed protein product [Rotaria sp. Silwood2]|nr:unnamed protein product [Rotaria sp. Silwood2]CAF4522814.1 unnamed protein product [Rotaria sp. Silwood2]
MNKFKLKAGFDRLPNEIILETWEYLSSNDIIYSFFNLNQRFNNLFMEQRRILQSFELPTSYSLFWEQSLSTMGFQIHTLILRHDNYLTPFHLFPNLKSIIISSKFFIDYEIVDAIMKSNQFQALISLKIKQDVKSQFHNNKKMSKLTSIILDEPYYRSVWESPTIIHQITTDVTLNSITTFHLNGGLLDEKKIRTVVGSTPKM